MNILESLVANVRKKKQELENFVGGVHPNQSVAPPAHMQYSPAAQAKLRSRYSPDVANARINAGTNTTSGPPTQQFNLARAATDSFKEAVPKVVKATGLAAGRVGVDAAQSASGFYDLASRGTGTSRVSKKLDRYAKSIDNVAQRQGVSPAYHIMQVPAQAASFFIPGTAEVKAVQAATKGAKAGSIAVKLAKAAERLDKPAARVVRAANKLEKGNAAQRITGAAIRHGTTGTNAINAITGTAADLGNESGKGHDISPESVAISAGMNTAMPFALPAAGQAGIEAIHGAAPAVKKTVKATQDAIQRAERRQNASDSVQKQLKTNSVQRRELQKRLKQANEAGLPTEHPEVRNLHAAMEKNIQDEYAIRTADPNRSVVRTVADKMLTARPGLSMKAVPDNSAEHVADVLGGGHGAFGPDTLDRAAADKLTPGDMQRAGVRFGNKNLKELARNLPEFKENPVMTYRKSDGVPAINQYGSRVTETPQPDAHHLEFKYKNGTIKLNPEAVFGPHIAAKLAESAQDGESFHFGDIINEKGAKNRLMNFQKTDNVVANPRTDAAAPAPVAAPIETPERLTNFSQASQDVTQQWQNPSVYNARKAAEAQAQAESAAAAEHPAAVNFTEADLQHAIDAHRGTSFDPEKRGADTLASHKQYIEQKYAELAPIAEKNGSLDEFNKAFKQFKDKSWQHTQAILGRKSRIISPMISGRGNFPVARMQKAAESEHRANTAALEYDQKMTSTLEKIARNEPAAVKVGDQGAVEATTGELNRLKSLQSAYKEINKRARKEDIASFINQYPEDVQKTVAEYMKYSGGTGIPSFHLTNLNSKIKRLETKAKQAAAVQGATADNIKLPGADVSIDKADNRLRISHDSKPDASVISDMKSMGLRWSPRNKAWQAPVTPRLLDRLERYAKKSEPAKQDAIIKRGQEARAAVEKYGWHARGDQTHGVILTNAVGKDVAHIQTVGGRHVATYTDGGRIVSSGGSIADLADTIATKHFYAKDRTKETQPIKVKKGNTRPDPLTSQSGLTVQFPQYNPKARSNAAVTRQINAMNQTLIDAAVAEARHKGDNWNLAQFEHMNVKNLSTSDIQGMHLYVFGTTDSIPLTYNGMNVTKAEKTVAKPVAKSDRLAKYAKKSEPTGIADNSPDNGVPAGHTYAKDSKFYVDTTKVSKQEYLDKHLTGIGDQRKGNRELLNGFYNDQKRRQAKSAALPAAISDNTVAATKAEMHGNPSEKINFNGKEYTVTDTLKTGGETKYKLTDTDGKELWTNEAGYQTAKARAEGEAKRKAYNDAKDARVQTHDIEIDGHKITASLDPEHFKSKDSGTVHLEFRSKGANPISETGYRSHFMNGSPEELGLTGSPEQIKARIQEIGQKLADENKPKSKKAAAPATTPAKESTSAAEPAPAPKATETSAKSSDEILAEKRPIAADPNGPVSQGAYAKKLGLSEGWSAGVGGIGSDHQLDHPIHAVHYVPGTTKRVNISADTEADLVKLSKKVDKGIADGTIKPSAAHDISFTSDKPFKKPDYPHKKSDETDKEYLKRIKDSLKTPEKLPENPAAYFDMSVPDAQTVPYNKLISRKSPEENIRGGNNAPKFMQAAADGKVGKRAPITVYPNGDGTYTVWDGNGTYTAAGKYGWKNMPVTVIPKQAVDDAQALVEKAAKANAPFQRQVKSLTAKLGDGFKYTEGPPKGVERIVEKAVSDYTDKAGKVDLSKVKDSIRGMITVSNPADIPKVIKHFEDNAQVIQVKNGYDSHTTGYRDAKIIIKSKTGHTGEIIIATPEMIKAKEELGGHKLYEISRSTSSTAEFQKLDKQMNKLYSEAEAATERRLASASSISVPSTKARVGEKGRPVSKIVPETSPPRSSTRTITSSTSKKRGNDLVNSDMGESPLSSSTVSEKLDKVNNRTNKKVSDTSSLNTDRIKATKKNKAFLDKETEHVIGKLGHKEVERIATDAGIDTNTHTIEEQAHIIAQQLNLRKEVATLAKQADEARKAGDLNKAARFLERAANAGAISVDQGASVARQLEARKIIANALATPQQRVFRLLDKAGVSRKEYAKHFAGVDFEDTQAVVKKYRELVPGKAADWLDTLRYNSMLSSPLTQAVNIFGNLQGLVVGAVEKNVRGLQDAVLGRMGHERKFARGEGTAYAKAAFSRKTGKEARQNFIDAFHGRGKYANTSLDENFMPLAEKGAKGAAYKALVFPMRILDASDKYFRTLAESGEESALIHRENSGIAIKGDREATKQAEADYRIFQTPVGTKGQGHIDDAFDTFASTVNKLRFAKNPVVSLPAKFAMPFVRTINNMAKQGIVDYSPLGFANMAGNVDKRTAFTRAVMGTAVFGASAGLIAQGDMTWGEPRDKDQKAQFRQDGKQPYSIRIGGHWVNFSKLHPSVAFPMAMTAAIHDAIENKKIDQGTADGVLEGIAKYGQFLADQSFAKNIGDTLAAIGGDKEKIASAVGNYGQQVVPYRAFTGWLARMSDSGDRKINTDKGYVAQQVENLMQQYPVLRQKTTQREADGVPVAANNQIFNSFSPVKVTTDRTGGAGGSYSSRTGTSRDKNAWKAGFTTPAARKFVAMSEEQQKAAAATDPEARALYDQVRAAKKSSAAPALRPAGLSSETTKILDKYDRLSDKGRDNYFNNNKTAEAEYIAAKYQSDKADGKLSRVEDIRRQQEVEKAAVGSEFDKEVRDIYSLNKTQIYDLVSHDPNGKSIADRLVKYGDALEGNDLGDNKLRDSKGNIAIRPKAKGSGGGSSSSVVALAKSFKTPYDELVKDRRQGASIARGAHLAKR